MTLEPTSVSTRALRAHLSDTLVDVSSNGARVGVTKNGKLVAFIVSVGDVEALEALEDAHDLAGYRIAKAEDSGERIALDAARQVLDVSGA